MKESNYLRSHLNFDIATYIENIILKDVNFLIHKCIRKFISIISNEIKNYNTFWICTEMVEKICEYVNFLDLKFTELFDTTMKQCINLVKKEYPYCETKFHYWIMIRTLEQYYRENDI